MAKKWIQGAIKRPGAFRAKAKRAGMSTEAYARSVIAKKKRGERVDDRTYRQARLALTLTGMRKKRRKG